MHRCHTVDPASLSRPFNATSINVAGPCRWFVSSKISSGCASVHLRQDVRHLAVGDDYLDRILLPSADSQSRSALCLSLRGISTGPNSSYRLGPGH